MMLTFKFHFPTRAANETRFDGRLPSLVEVLALVLPLAAAVGMGYYLVSGLPKGEDMRYERARDDIRAIRSVMLSSPMGMPDTGAGLQALVDRGELPLLPQDPWGRPYQYRNPGTMRAYDLFSLGPDGVESKDDLDAWNLYPIKQ